MADILAIDPGTRCGWAHTCNASGTWDLSVRPDESSGMRLIRLRGKLNLINEAHPFALLVYEAARNMEHGPAIRVSGEIQGQIKVWCEDHRIDYRGYSPGEIKKFATGKGNSGKVAMLDAAKSRLDYQGHSYDEADALWILELGKDEYK